MSLRRLLLAGGSTASTTTRLFHLNGTNGATSFPDSASSATVTVNGNAQLTTTSPKFGSACALLDGSGDWWKSANDGGLDFGSGDFCIEGWINWASIANAGIFHMFPGTPGGTTSGFALGYNGTDLVLYDTTAVRSYAFTPSTGTWYHWAVFRIGTTIYVSIDGVIKGSQAGISTSITGNNLNLGMYYSTSFTHNGKLDEVRVSKGTAVYSSSGFTPPSAEFTYP